MPPLHRFGDDALGALCLDAMAVVMYPIDVYLGHTYTMEAQMVAERVACADPLAPVPLLFEGRPWLQYAYAEAAENGPTYALEESCQ